MCKFGDKSTNGQEKTISLGTSKGSVLELDHGIKTPKELFGATSVDVMEHLYEITIT